MSKHILLVFLFMCMQSIHAHDADKAYFEISFQNNNTIVKAELPWTVRNALLAYDANYDKAKTFEETNAILFNYVKEKIKLLDRDGNHLILLKAELNANKGHNHATNYILTYKGTAVEKISNTFLFEINSTQENYHSFYSEKDTIVDIITNSSTPTAIIKLKSNENSLIYMIVGGFLLVIGLIVIFSKLRSKQT